MNIASKIGIKAAVLILGVLTLGCTDTKEREAVQPESRLTITPPEIAFPKEGGEQTFKISTNRGWILEKTDGSWFEVLNEMIGQDTAKVVTLKALANEGIETRTSKITVTAGTKLEQVNISQFGSQAEIMLPASEIKLDCADTTLSVVVNANVEVTATADEGITVEKAAVKSTLSLTSQMFNVKVSENRNTVALSRKVTFSGKDAEAKVLTLTQNKFEGRVSCSDVHLNIGASQTEAWVKVTANLPWTATLGEHTPADWIAFDGAAEGSIGTTQLKFKLAQNLEAMSRSCEFTINYAGGDPIVMTVVQSGAGKTRERDSLALVALWNAATFHGTDVWDWNKPMSEWDNVIISNSETYVMRLALEGWNFPNGIPAEIGQLAGLAFLDMNRCTLGVTKLPAEIGQLANLEEWGIYFMNSAIEFSDMTGMTRMARLIIQGKNVEYGHEDDERQVLLATEHIGDLKTLTRLELMGTTLTELPAECMNLPELKNLDTRSSDISRIQPELTQLKKLEVLDMSKCKLKGKIPPELFVGTVLKSVDFSSNELEGKLPIEMFQLESLTNVILSWNNLTGPLPLELLTSNISNFSVYLNRLGTVGAQEPLDPRFSQDPRWMGMGGAGGGGWFGPNNILIQQEGWGWAQ